VTARGADGAGETTFCGPLPRGADADFGGLGWIRHRPPVNDALAEPAPSIHAERRLSVQLHPVPSLGLSRLAALTSREARMNNLLRDYN